MTDRTQTVAEIFEAAFAIADPRERQELLDSACGDDEELRKRVDALLAASDKAGDFMRQPAVSRLTKETSNVHLTEGPGTRISNYRLLEKIGEGGFGVVYMADQLKPIKRRVALKIIKLGMDTKQVIARFEAERQALALMEHPHIATVLDAGTTETGRPFFVMELVHGEPINEYCDGRKMSTDERLELFTQVCTAIQHAHQKGIIHRDIKPNNILVTTSGDRPLPKVIDFGIAKATQGRLTERTLFTQFRQFIGTPTYMSPEQAQMSAVDVDTRSDVYSLGVLLYELLTGQTPLDSSKLDRIEFDELCRRIREEEPQKPSTRLNTMTQAQQTLAAQRRGTEPSRLRFSIRQDLDWIVMKAMEKDRSRRYPTATALADDIQRYLNKESVSAVPPSATYRFLKFSRRNRAALATFGAIFVVLILATIASSWLATWAIKAEREKSHLLEAAEAAREKETSYRKLAEKVARGAVEGELRARQIAYVSDMILAPQVLQRNNLRRARQVLDRNRPIADEADLRNWEWRALWQRCQSDASRTFGDPSHAIWSASLSPNGKWLATGGLKGEILIWDMAKGGQLRVLSPRINSGEELGRVEFTKTGDRLFATTPGGVVRVWSVGDWTKSELKFEHNGPIRSISLSGDEKMLAVFPHRHSHIVLWDTNNSAASAEIATGWGGGVQTGVAVFSPDGKWLAVGLGNGEILMVDPKSRTVRFRFPAPRESELVKTLAFSLDSRLLASGTGFEYTNVDIWDVSTQLQVTRLEGHTDYLCSLAFSPDGMQLASGSADQTIRLWDTENWVLSTILRGHKHEVWALCYSTNGSQLVSGCKDGEICVWNTDQISEERWPIEVPHAVSYGFRGFPARGRASFSHDGQWLATLGKGDNRDITVRLRTATNLQEADNLTELGRDVTGLLFSPHERLLVVGDTLGRLTWLDPLHPKTKLSQVIMAEANVYPIGFTRDGRQLLLVAERSQEETRIHCLLWSVVKKQLIQSWPIPSNTESIAFSPDGQLVATGQYDGTIGFWNTEDPGAPRMVKRSHIVRGITFSPDGKKIASVNEYGDIEIWDSASRASLGFLHGNMKAVFAATFSPDGSRLATSGSAGESVKVWDLATKQAVATLVAPGYSFGMIQFSPDGNAILAANIDGDLFMWRVPSMEYISQHGNSMVRESKQTYNQ